MQKRARVSVVSKRMRERASERASERIKSRALACERINMRVLRYLRIISVESHNQMAESVVKTISAHKLHTNRHAHTLDRISLYISM